MRMMHPEYTIQKLHADGFWRLLSPVYNTTSLDAARDDCARVQRVNPRNQYRIAVRLAGEWCELQQEASEAIIKCRAIAEEGETK